MALSCNSTFHIWRQPILFASKLQLVLLRDGQYFAIDALGLKPEFIDIQSDTLCACAQTSSCDSNTDQRYYQVDYRLEHFVIVPR